MPCGQAAGLLFFSNSVIVSPVLAGGDENEEVGNFGNGGRWPDVVLFHPGLGVDDGHLARCLGLVFLRQSRHGKRSVRNR